MTTYKVRVTTPKQRTRWVPVTAEYFKIEQGALIFRSYNKGSNTYPNTVHVFAAGTWTEVATSNETVPS